MGQGECADLHSNCSAWAHAGECHKQSKTMQILCKASCRLCNSDDLARAGRVLEPSKATHCCCDVNEFCLEWAQQAQCEDNTEFMHVSCPFSCGTCGTAKASVE